jgi:hypothetical protein
MSWRPAPIAAAVLAVALVALALLLAACEDERPPITSPLEDTSTPLPATAADVVAVEVSGDPGAYTFNVTVSSPDTGCDQWADWWEVVSEDGALLYRRVLLHSHVTEQPFTRSGGPVSVAADEVLIVRAHMNDGGYGGAALRGSVAEGFADDRPPLTFAAELASRDPLPEGCAG